MLFILEDNADRIDEMARCLRLYTSDIKHVVRKTAPEAIHWLRDHIGEVTMISLDHDLIVPDYEGDEGDGRDVVNWLVKNTTPKPFVLHTSNARFRVSMQMELEEYSWEYETVYPYEDVSWIEETWIGKIKGLS